MLYLHLLREFCELKQAIKRPCAKKRPPRVISGRFQGASSRAVMR